MHAPDRALRVHHRHPGRLLTAKRTRKQSRSKCSAGLCTYLSCMARPRSASPLEIPTPATVFPGLTIHLLYRKRALLLYIPSHRYFPRTSLPLGSESRTLVVAPRAPPVRLPQSTHSELQLRTVRHPPKDLADAALLLRQHHQAKTRILLVRLSTGSVRRRVGVSRPVFA
jgi:hypothetical protein